MHRRYTPVHRFLSRPILARTYSAEVTGSRRNLPHHRRLRPQRRSAIIQHQAVCVKWFFKIFFHFFLPARPPPIPCGPRPRRTQNSPGRQSRSGELPADIRAGGSALQLLQFLPPQGVDRIAGHPPRRRELHIPRFRLTAKAHSFRRSSLPSLSLRDISP